MTHIYEVLVYSKWLISFYFLHFLIKLKKKWLQLNLFFHNNKRRYKYRSFSFLIYGEKWEALKCWRVRIRTSGPQKGDVVPHYPILFSFLSATDNSFSATKKAETFASLSLSLSVENKENPQQPNPSQHLRFLSFLIKSLTL